MNVKKWFEELIDSEVKKPIPILSFPCTSLIGCSVRQLVTDADKQALGMKAVADKVETGASVSMMDLSVEAEAFGAEVKFSEDEIPAITGALVDSPEDAEGLQIPKVGAGRTGNCVAAIKKVTKLITDRPVFAGVIGPFSLAGRLMDVSNAMINCYDEPEMVHLVLKKCTAFLIDYIKAFKDAGADGVVLAEPLAGLLSPSLCGEFSSPYVKQIQQATQTDEFGIVYHNCGGSVIHMAEQLNDIGCMAYHFGNAIDMAQMLPLMPSDKVLMGNIDPSSQFFGGTEASIRQSTLALMERLCPEYPNYVISSGCDIPPASPWENITAFFDAVREYYSKAR